MKNFLKSTLIGLLIGTQAYAGLPPDSLKAQNDAAATTTFNYQVPLSQATRLGGTTALIETGNTNLIANPGAEGTTPLPTAFADGGTTIPVSLTGGSPNTTCTRTTSSPLTGSGSHLMTVNSGATRQGEGCAFSPITIPTAYQGQQAIFSFPFSITGSIVAGDVIPYCYDITNSSLLAPTFVANPILGLSGQMLATFQIPSNTSSLRCALYIARTSTGALTVKYDDVKFYPAQAVTGMAGSDWKSYTPTFAGFGTVSGVNIWYRQTGDSLEISGHFTTGASSGTAAMFSLPPGLKVDPTKIAASGLTSVGRMLRNISGGTSSGDYANVMFANASDLSNIYFGTSNNTLAPNATQNGNSLTAASEIQFIQFAKIPIASWSSNVTMAQSSTYRISSYLANGVRVTGSAPTALGQYRARYRAAANNSALTDVAPTTAPSASNGMQIYGNVTWSAAGTSGQVGAYDIFIGKFKNFRIEWYQNTGFSGPFIANYYVDGTNEHGAVTAYDPSTGVLTVDATFIDNGSNASRTLGYVLPGSSVVVNSGYFDVIVSENALAVGVQAPRSEVQVQGSPGTGSTNTKVRRWTNVPKNTGTAITLTQSTTAGDIFTVNEDGIYAISYNASMFATPFWMAIGINCTQLTTNIESMTDACLRSVANDASGNTMGNTQWTGFLSAGQKIYLLSDATAATTQPQSLQLATVTKVSN